MQGLEMTLPEFLRSNFQRLQENNIFIDWRFGIYQYEIKMEGDSPYISYRENRRSRRGLSEYPDWHRTSINSLGNFFIQNIKTRRSLLDKNAKIYVHTDGG